MGTFRPTGVNPQLVWNVRNALVAFGESLRHRSLRPSRVRLCLRPPLLRHRVAPVDDQALAGHVGRAGRAQPRHRPGDLIGAAAAPERSDLALPPFALGL